VKRDERHDDDEKRSIHGKPQSVPDSDLLGQDTRGSDTHQFGDIDALRQVLRLEFYDDTAIRQGIHSNYR
jgi:hypothetical protein